MGSGVILLMCSVFSLGLIGFAYDDDWQDGNDDDRDDKPDVGETVTAMDGDVITTGDGDDVITNALSPNSDEDELATLSVNTGAGDDTIDFEVPIVEANIDTGTGNDLVSFEEINYGTVVTGSGNDIVNGSVPFDTTFKLGAGDDDCVIESTGFGMDLEIYGEDGNDAITLTKNGTVYGGEGNDTLKASNYNLPGSIDRGSIYGEAGDDVLELDALPVLFINYGTAEGDTVVPLYGGEGNDTFRFSAENLSAATVTDFLDKIDDIPEGGEDSYTVEFDQATSTVSTNIGYIGDYEPGADTIDLNVKETDGFTFTSVEVAPTGLGGDISEVTDLNLVFKNADESMTQKLHIRVVSESGAEIDLDDILFSGAQPTDGITLPPGTDGDDEITFNPGYDNAFLDAGAGNDTITVGGLGTVYGGDGDDIIKASNFFATSGSTDPGFVDGQAGNDTLELNGKPLIYDERGNYAGAGDTIKPLVGGEGADKFIISTENITSDIITNFIAIQNGDIPEPDPDHGDGYAMFYDADTGTVSTSFAIIGDFEPGVEMISLDVSETDGFSFTSVEITPGDPDGPDFVYLPDYVDDDSTLSFVHLYFKNEDETITQKISARVFHAADTALDAGDLLFLGAEPKDGVTTMA